MYLLTPNRSICMMYFKLTFYHGMTSCLLFLIPIMPQEIQSSYEQSYSPWWLWQHL